MSSKDSEAREAGEFLNADLHASISKSAATAPSLESPSRDPPDEDGEEADGAVQAILRESSHPTVAVFHVLFKIGAIVSYLILGLFTKSFVIQFVVTVTLLAFDFWTVKNVTGRMLVGLRWWHEVGEDGVTQKWRFETVQDRDSLNVTDGRIFWWTLYLSPVIWILLGVVCVLKFNVSYLLMVVIALTLSSANIVGYYKCNKDATEQIRNYIGKTMLGHAMEQSGFGRLSGRLSNFV
eukprot:GFKZ01001644.1.p1 GENE.GFKZ01001644.1~~GFKZ01001644.1.p1  ORF type:complete len:237 (-),score=31.01 GFKZ01001644.1:880-1590(-)